MSTTLIPHIVAAPVLADVLPPRRERGRVSMFIYRHPTIAIGGVLLALILAIAVFAPYLFTVDPTQIAPAKRTRAPSALYWFGTDMLGRDIYSRTLFGARVSLEVGFAVAAVSSVVGMFIGVCAGFIRLLDSIVMRVMDGLMSIPSILLAIALMALIGASVQNVVIAISIAEIPRVARLVRGVVLSLREQAYVEAAIASGTRAPMIVWKHIDHRAGDVHLCVRHAGRGHAVVHRRRHATDHSKLGQHHGRGPRAVAGEALHRVLPGGVPVDHRAGGEPARRRAAGRA